jgi:hypothetical protein
MQPSNVFLLDRVTTAHSVNRGQEEMRECSVYIAI